MGSCSQVMEDGAGDGQAVGGVQGNAAAVPDRCGEEGAQPEGKTLNLQVCLSFCLTESARSQMQVAKMSFLQSGWTYR